jgi:multidrug resistance efflux pump
MKIKKNITRIILMLAVGLLLAACGSKSATSTPTSGVDTSQSASSSSGGVVVEGRIVPRDNTSLFFSVPGDVAELAVSEGEFVKKGTIIARLDNPEQFQASVAAAQAEVISSQQSLDMLNRTATLSYNQAVLDEIAAERAYYDALKAWDEFDQTRYEDDLDTAKADVSAAKSDLKDAQDEFAKYSSLDKNNADRKRTKSNLETAQTKYDDALAKQAEIENSYREVKSAVDLAQAKLDEAGRTREIRQDGADKDQLALSQGHLDAANAQLAAAQAALSKLELVAPYDGVVAKVDISVGESVIPNQTVVTFADLSEWYVETTDLTENEVVSVVEGQNVTIVPDALPNLELPGVVETISKVYSEKSGDIVYKARIRLTEADPQLRWGMTVETRFLEGK